ncbi:MAG TPA: chemotaxis protein CheD [Nitrospirae bacterium]|nr:chemotaxis protein CheD [Nitrospirota bacterium]HDZ02456.1 chemotaxis protein CheD [Nitrospirota bacterium]
MRPSETKLPNFYLKPGQIYIAEKPTLVSTVLGSCISVTMFNSRFKIGAISHGMLPLCKSMNSCAGECHESFKYVDCSIRRMIKMFNTYGIKSGEIEVKLFGGADVLGSGNVGNIMSVGGMNIETALKMIRTKGLNIVISDVGGLCGRKIYFYTHTGEIFLKRLEKMGKIDLPDQRIVKGVY